MKKTYFYSSKHKQLEILKNNIKMSLFAETPANPSSFMDLNTQKSGKVKIPNQIGKMQ